MFVPKVESGEQAVVPKIELNYFLSDLILSFYSLLCQSQYRKIMYLSFDISVHTSLYIYLSFFLSFSLFVFLFVCLAIHPCIHINVPSIYLSIHLSICLVYLLFNLHVSIFRLYYALHACSLQQTAAYLAARLAWKQGWIQDFHGGGGGANRLCARTCTSQVRRS